MKIILVLALIALEVKMAHACSARESNKCLHTEFNSLSSYFEKTPVYAVLEANQQQCKYLQEVSSCLRKAFEDCKNSQGAYFELILPYRCSQNGAAEDPQDCTRGAATDCLKTYSKKLGRSESSLHGMGPDEQADGNAEHCKDLGELETCMGEAFEKCGTTERTRVGMELPYSCGTE